MLFTDFTQSQDGLIILLKNYDALLNVKDIKFYQEVVSGTFTKKEFRWAFTPNHWSSWQLLNPNNFGIINPRGRATIFFEIRYVLTALKSGKVTSFLINYTQGAVNTIDSTIITTIPIPKKVTPIIVTTEPDQEKVPKKVVPPTIEVPPVEGCKDCDEETLENLPKYANLDEPVITPKSITVVNADTLNLKSDKYYLFRPYHQGTQKIKTIDGLQRILNNLTNGLQNSIFTGTNVAGAGVGVLYNSGAHELLFKRLAPGLGMTITEDSNGIINLAVDIAAASRDPSTDELFVEINNLQIQITDISIYIDAQFLQIDNSLNYFTEYNIIQDASITGSYVYNLIQDNSIVYLTEYVAILDASIININADIIRTDVYQTIQDVSILENTNNISILDASIIKTNIYQAIQDASIAALDASSNEADIIRLDIYNAIQDASILDIENINSTQDSSILQNILDIIRTDIYQVIQDVSISVIEIYQAIQDASIALGGAGTDASISRLDDYNIIQDISIFQNEVNILTLDTSIVRIDAYQLLQDTSLALGLAQLDASVFRIDVYNAIQDSSIFNIDTDITRIDAYQIIQDASIALADAGYNIIQDNSIIFIQAAYIPDVSLSNNFIWSAGLLYIDVSAAGGGVSPTNDYATYEPHIADISIYRTNDDVTQIITLNSFGTKQVDFSYDINGNVDQIDISTYGLTNRTVTFIRDLNNNINGIKIV